MEIIFILVSGALTILAVNLLLVSLLSYHRYRNSKLLLISIVFLLFFVKGMLMSYYVLVASVGLQSPLFYVSLVDLVILILLYVTSVKS